jgi:hypothetical protein
VAVIDIGAAAIDRASRVNLLYTFVEGSNPANDTGKIDTVEMWLDIAGTGIEVATFIHEGSNVLSTRDYEAIGSVAAGSKQTFTGLNMDVATGDYIGICGTAGEIDTDSSGGTGLWYKSGDNIPCTSQTFAWIADYIISLYGTGASVTAWAKSLSDTVAISDSISKGIGVAKADSVAIADSFARVVEFNRSLSDTVAIADVISKAIEVPLADAVAITEAALVKDIGKPLSDQVAITDVFTRVVSFLRLFSDTVTIADSITKAVSKSLSDTLSITDALAKDMSIALDDQVAITDAISKAFGLTLTDSVAIADLIRVIRNLRSLRELGYARALDALRNLLSEREIPRRE